MLVLAWESHCISPSEINILYSINLRQVIVISKKQKTQENHQKHKIQLRLNPPQWDTRKYAEVDIKVNSP